MPRRNAARLNIDVDKELHHELKLLACKQALTLTDVVTLAVKSYMKKHTKKYSNIS